MFVQSTVNKANFPEHITQPTQYGPRVKATATYFNQVHFVPFDRLHEVLQDCYNLSASQGSFVNFNYKCASTSTSIVSIDNCFCSCLRPELDNLFSTYSIAC